MESWYFTFCASQCKILHTPQSRRYKVETCHKSFGQNDSPFQLMFLLWVGDTLFGDKSCCNYNLCYIVNYISFVFVVMMRKCEMTNTQKLTPAAAALSPHLIPTLLSLLWTQHLSQDKLCISFELSPYSLKRMISVEEVYTETHIETWCPADDVVPGENRINIVPAILLKLPP